MMGRTGLAVAVVLSMLALAGCTAHAEPAAAADRHLQVEGYIEPDEHAVVRVQRATLRAATIGIDGVTITDDGAGLQEPPEGLAALARTAQRGGARAELLISNYSSELGDFSPQIGTALLGDARHSKAVARALAARADALGMEGVQIDLESLRSRDQRGLVVFASEVRRAVHARLGSDARVSMAVMASTDAAGFRETGYDLGALRRYVDRFVLMTYDQHGPWSSAGPVGALPWAERVVRAARGEGVPSRRIDLGIAGYGYAWGGPRDGEQLTPAVAKRLAGGAASWSARDGEWSAVLGDGTVLHWSDARSYRARAALAGRLHLHGVALWSLNSLAVPAA